MSSNEQAKKPQAVYRKDYKKPDYQIDTVDLDFDLDPEQTIVKSKMAVRSDYDRSGKVQPLVLNGDELKLNDIKIDGKKLTPKDYDLDEKGLTIKNPPADFTLEIETEINPTANTTLEGLYISNGVYTTQCEPEGFRRMTFYPDHSDVMAKFSTIVRGDKEALPKMLSNGNMVEEGTENGKDFVKWVDPHKKPSYLFALVAGDLGEIKDKFTTMSGKDVDLHIFCEKGKEDKCTYAMESIKKSMKWDEEKFGREYDLEQFSVVAVSDFNQGAMENKSLNVFNDAYVLADPKTATDSDFASIESIIGHEYFHNWTGNRITCQDWFNLTLKEGLTVYRDQEFSADMLSRPVKRIDDVSNLRAGQFPEDSGPMAHPTRPESYVAINNFYSSTVYSKGAEVIRMQEKLLGKEKFHKAMDLYFDRHDGQAVTCDDFVKCMEDTSKKDLTQFKRWYSQAGTPEVTAKGKYDANTKTYELTLSQNTKATPGQSTKEPFVIPQEIGLIDSKGNDMPLQLKGEQSAKGTSRIVTLESGEQTFKFVNVEEPPVLSANRGFTAPVNMNINYTDKERIHMMQNDSDSFNRFEAGQQYAAKLMLNMIKEVQAGKEPTVDSKFVKAMGSYLKDPKLEKAFVARAMSLPGESYLAQKMDVIDVDAIHKARETMQKAVANEYKYEFKHLYLTNRSSSQDAYVPDAKQSGERSLKNCALSYLSKTDDKDMQNVVASQYEDASNMTDTMASLAVMINSGNPSADKSLSDFYNKHKENHLVVNKWISLQSTSSQEGTLDKVKELLDHEAFDMTNPNKVRVLLGGFSSNPTAFHAKDGSGYEFISEQLIKLDDINPMTAAKMASSLCKWQKHDAGRQEMMKKALNKIMQKPKLSENLFEVVSKSLDMGKDIAKEKCEKNRDDHREASAEVSKFAEQGNVNGFVSGTEGKKNLAHNAAKTENVTAQALKELDAIKLAAARTGR